MGDVSLLPQGCSQQCASVTQRDERVGCRRFAIPVISIVRVMDPRPLLHTSVLATLLLFHAASGASATSIDQTDCGKRVGAILAHVYPSARPITGGYVLGDQLIGLDPTASASVACRVWPAHPDLTLLAVPLISSDDRGYGDVALFVLQTDTLAIKAQSLLNDRASDDDFPLTAVDIEPVDDRLAAQGQMFGLRLERQVADQNGATRAEALYLLAFADGRIRERLSGLRTAEVNETYRTESCKGSRLVRSATLSLLNSRHHGYPDIDIIEQANDSQQIGAAKHCADRASQSTKHFQLTFDGTHYPLPKALKAIE